MNDSAIHGAERAARRAIALLLPLFVLVEVNYPSLTPLSQLALFAMLGMSLALLPREGEAIGPIELSLRRLAVVLLVIVCGYIVIQTEPMFSGWWQNGTSLGSRAGGETGLDLVLGTIGLLLVFVAARRSVGMAIPLLSLLFIAYARWGSYLPDWLLPIRGYSVARIVGQTFLHSQGVFGVALKVMFSYVFLFVVFGSILEETGATRFVINASRRLFRGSQGAAAKVAVLSSGLMGSLSGSAVANTATTGIFTIPMMRSAGFSRHIAAGLEAAASSGGALVPPVMGAGAYMMLEIIDPPVSYLQIVRAALLPALLYYFSLFLIVHLHSKKISAVDAHDSGSSNDVETAAEAPESLSAESAPLADEQTSYEGVIFIVGLSSLVVTLLLGYSVFRAVTVAMGAVLLSSSLNARTRLSLGELSRALTRASENGVALISAAASVGVIVGVVTLTGIGTRLPAIILSLAEQNLIAALVLIMISSIILGMGLPSSVCYLLMATLIGPVLTKLGVVPLAAHLFIFYFGMMSMVTPPVALAAYAASSIAGSKLWDTSLAAFRFALVGFALPYMFVLRPQLLMLTPTGQVARASDIIAVVLLSTVAIVALTIAVSGYSWGSLTPVHRGLFLAAGLLLIYRGNDLVWGGLELAYSNLLGALLLVLSLILTRHSLRRLPRQS
ncbi:MAG: TRAP transporter fused permease subunit [Thermoanaerobaculia bacterium]